MAENTPTLSVGLAVYNGERFLREAVDSILSQTFSDFELIISDNASSDRTEAICRDYAARDGRIHYHRNATNIGGANNENQTFRLSRGKYFRWAAHDDVCEPTLFEKAVAILEENPDVVLCYSQSQAIDAAGKPLGITSWEKASGREPHRRFAALIRYDHHCEATYGVIRSEVMRRTRLQLNYTDSDRTLLAELSLYGRFVEIPEPLFRKRFHEGNVYDDWRGRMAWFDAAFANKIVFPHWLQFGDYFVTIGRVPLSASDKMRCYRAMVPWFFRYGKSMVKDVLVALKTLLGRTLAVLSGRRTGRERPVS